MPKPSQISLAWNDNDMKYTPPTLEMIKLQCVKIGLPEIEGEKFYSYYESNGWKVGKNKMVSWTNALNHWRLVWLDRQPSPNKPRSIYELTKIAEAKQKIADSIRLKHTLETPTGRQWDSAEQRAKYIELCKDIKALNEQIAQMK